MEAREGDLKRAHLWTDVLESILGDLKLKSQYTTKNPGAMGPESSPGEKASLGFHALEALYCFLMVCCLRYDSLEGRATPLALLRPGHPMGDLGFPWKAGIHAASLFPGVL